MGVRARGLAEAFLTLTALGASASFLAPLGWPWELASHFPVQYAAVLLGVAAAAAVARMPRHALLCGALGLWHLGQVLWSARPLPEGGGGGPEASLVVFNVHTANGRFTEVEDYLLARAPDAVVLLEVSPRWWTELRRLRKAYPHALEEPRGDNFGIAVLSKTPLEEARFVLLSPVEVPSVVARLRVGGRPLSLVATHPLPPASAWHAADRDAQLAALAALVAELAPPVVVAGDLNATPWSPVFRRLLRDTGLLDSRRGFGVHATWPTDIPFARIPLDHVLVSPGVRVLSRSVGEPLGSDHAPVEVRLALPRP